MNIDLNHKIITVCRLPAAAGCFDCESACPTYKTLAGGRFAMHHVVPRSHLVFT
jgi:hypothetical protein